MFKVLTQINGGAEIALNADLLTADSLQESRQLKSQKEPLSDESTIMCAMLLVLMRPRCRAEVTTLGAIECRWEFDE